MKVLISDKLSESGLNVFKKFPQIEVIYDPELPKDVEKLKRVIAEVDGIAIRSATKLNAEIIDCAKTLKVIGRAGIGVDNVDIPYASKRGIIVMNTPTGNVVTTAEHAIAMMCALTRQIPQATASIKAGKWEKNKFMGSELYQKTLGIVGCGNIGKIVADRAQGLRMNVIAYDPFLTDEIAQELRVRKVEFDELLKSADYVSIHTPLNDKTKYLFNRAAFQKMKKGVYLVNCARGGIVHEGDLAWAIGEKIVAGAALDVFEEEPVKADNPLLKLENVVCTPHLGASTEEAQENVAIDVAEQIADYLVNGTIVNALNTPSASKEVLRHLEPAVKLCQMLGKFHGQLCDESPTRITISYYGEITRYPLASLTTAILQGILEPMLSNVAVNAVNAPYLAKERGIRIEESKMSAHSDYSTLIEITLRFKTGERVIAGTLFGKDQPRIVRYNNVSPEVRPEGVILIVENEDRPGVVGRVGTYLGQHQVNITRMQLGLDEKSGKAVAFYNVGADVAPEVLKGFKAIDGIISLTKVVL
jgi:D-3-phosphoglycerate dehydrogenase